MSSRYIEQVGDYIEFSNKIIYTDYNIDHNLAGLCIKKTNIKTIYMASPTPYVYCLIINDRYKIVANNANDCVKMRKKLIDLLTSQEMKDI